MTTVSIAIQKTAHPKTPPTGKKLGFGQFFTDHMFLMDYQKEKGWLLPRIVPYGPVTLDPAAAVFHYGQAMFEGLKAFRGTDGKVRLFRLEMHAQRMNQNAPRLCMPAIPQEIFLQAVRSLVDLDQQWIPKEKGSSLYIRPTMIGAEPFLGVRPAQKYIFFIILSPCGAYYDEIKPLDIWIEDRYARTAPGGLGEVKAGANYVASLLAATEAKAKGYAQVLWLDAAEKKFIEEVGTMNVFIRIGKEILTPNRSGTILAGVTRDCTISLLKKWGVPVVERLISVEEVLAAHRSGTLMEVFGTGTAAVISFVGGLGYKNQKMLIQNGQPGEIATKLYNAITGIQYGEAPDPDHWTELI